MGEIKSPLPVKLFVGMLTADPALFAVCAASLRERYGLSDYESPALPWDLTKYYQDELGSGVLRKFLFFAHPVDPGLLPSVKLFTNSLEQALSTPGNTGFRRRINIDPGYLTESKVVLATTKDFAHRLYIGQNIYGEVTLRYDTKKHSYRPHDLTFPDFRCREYLDIFNTMRKALRCALHK